MSNLEQLAVELTNEGLKLSGPLTHQDGDKSSLYAFIEIFRSSEGRQTPSNIRLRQIAARFSESGTSITFILNDVSNAELESGLRATLMHAFPDLVRNAFLTLEETSGVVWVVPKGNSTRAVKSAVEDRARLYLENAGLTLAALKLTVDEHLPSRTAILSELRVAAPTSLELLTKRLALKGFVEPPPDYVNRHLDALRKAGQVVRRADALYCLTASALKALGTDKKRRGPDVTRLLDLARRGKIE